MENNYGNKKSREAPKRRRARSDGGGSLEFEPTSQIHDTFWIVLLRNLPQSGEVIAVDVFQGCIVSGVVVVHRHVVQVSTLFPSHEFFQVPRASPDGVVVILVVFGALPLEPDIHWAHRP